MIFRNLWMIFVRKLDSGQFKYKKLVDKLTRKPCPVNLKTNREKHTFFDKAGFRQNVFAAFFVLIIMK